MTPIRIALVAGTILLAALIVRAALSADFFEAFARIGADPWGLVSLVDLYLGFIMFAVVIGLIERPVVTAVLVVALLILGNVVGAIWLAVRLPELGRRLAQPKSL